MDEKPPRPDPKRIEYEPEIAMNYILHLEAEIKRKDRGFDDLVKSRG